MQPHEGQQFRGLGHVDSRKDMLTVRLEYQLSRQTDDTSKSIPTGSVKRRRHSKKAQKAGQILDKSVDISLAQDKTALHSRKGDTGSVLWKARFASGLSPARSCSSSYSASISQP